jgi:hypothetical protein
MGFIIEVARMEHMGFNEMPARNGKLDFMTLVALPN